MESLEKQIRFLREQGRSYSEIQMELGCSKGTISYHLGAGQKKKNLDRQQKSRNKLRIFLQQYKQENPCVDCLEFYPYWVMDFDHLRDKNFSISQMARSRGASMDVLLEEIEKCELVCANCHRTRTHFRSKKTDTSKDMLDVSEYY